MAVRTTPVTVADGDQLSEGYFNGVLNYGYLGQVIWMDLSIAGAVSKATLQGVGWAIQDGTTPATQGIASADITTTRNLENKFIRASDDELSSATGGADTMAHTHTIAVTGWGTASAATGKVTTSGSAGASASPNTSAASNTENRPAFFEMVAFMKVKLAV